MRRILSIALISVGLGTFASADTFNLHQGWNLVGSSSSIDLSKDFNNSNISVVWGYKNGQWQYFTSNDAIKSQIGNKYTMFTKTSPNEGFWVYAKKNFIVNLNSENNSSTSINQIPKDSNIEKLEKYLKDNDLSTINYNLENKTLLINPDQIMTTTSNGYFYGYDYKGHNIYLNYKAIELGAYNNIYVFNMLNDPAFKLDIAPVKTIGKQGLKIIKYNTLGNNIEKHDLIVLNGNKANAKIDSIVAAKNLFDNVNFLNLTKDDIVGNWTDKETNMSFEFKNDGTFKLKMPKDPNFALAFYVQDGETGTYTISNGGIIMNFSNGITAYSLAPSTINENNKSQLTLYSIFIDSNTNSDIRGGEVFLLNK